MYPSTEMLISVPCNFIELSFVSKRNCERKSKPNNKSKAKEVTKGTKIANKSRRKYFLRSR